MTPENKAKALESIAEWLGIIDDGLAEHGDFQYVLLELRDLIQPPEEAEEIRRLKARIDELESEAKARSQEIYDLHVALSKAENKQLSKEEIDRLCDKAWDLTP